MEDIENEGSHLGVADGVVIAVYFAFVISVGVWSSRRSKNESTGDYFLASRNMHWLPVGASLFASNIGSGHFIGLAGSGAGSGIGVAGFELSAIFILMLLGWLFVPVYLSAKIYTMPEYLRERFGGSRIHFILSVVALLLYIFTKISADLYAGALFIKLALNKSSPEWLYISIAILLLIAAAFTIAGGLTAVIWTDFVQTVLMIFGAFILMGVAFYEVGGYERLVQEYPTAVAKIRAGNGTCGIPPSDYMNLLRSPVPGASDFPWTGMIFGLAVNSVWYWCTDQVIVQRTLASKNLSHAKGGCIFASYLKLLPLWLLVFPGMIARVLFPDRVGCADPDECEKICGNEKGCTDIAYAELVIKLLPTGLSGLMLAVMMAALMSSLTSIFNSASTIFTIDIWTRFRKKSSEKELVNVGRVFVVFIVVISVLWIPVIEVIGKSNLFDYIQAISSFLAPPICAVFVLAIFWERTTEVGAFWGMMAGLVVGLIRFALQFAFPAPSCDSGIPDNRPFIVIATVGNIHYLHFSIISFAITAILCVALSTLSEPIPKKCLHRLTFWSRFSTEVRVSKDCCKDKQRLSNFPSKTKDNDGQTNIELKKRNQNYGTHDTNTFDCHAVTAKEKEAAERATELIYEEPKWKRFVNINSIICMSITIFFWGFYA